MDVTGAMRSQVEEMLGLAGQIPDVAVEILSVEEAGNAEWEPNGELIGTLIAGD